MSSLEKQSAASGSRTEDGWVTESETSQSLATSATSDPGRFWRSIDELSQTPEVLEQLRREFPDVNQQDLSGLSRRQFTRLMAASLALAGASMTGCRRWPEQVVRPQSERTEGFLPGVAEYFATQFELGGVATGLLAKSVDGRPIKIEGNDLHPFSNGAAGVFAQASILELYDPDRTRGYIYRPENAPASSQSSVNSSKGERGISPNAKSVADASGFEVIDRVVDSNPPKANLNSKETFENFVKSHFGALQNNKGRGLHVLAQSTSSPTFAQLRRQFLLAFPESRWHVYQPLDRDQEFAGSRLAFDRVVRPQFHLQNASTIVCFDCDLLGLHPAHQRWCRDWAAGRNPAGDTYSRMWVFESGYSITGAAADIRQPVRPSEMLSLVAAIAEGVGVTGVARVRKSVDGDGRSVATPATVNRLIQELQTAGAKSLLVAGPSQSPQVHALVHAINQRLGCVGTTVTYTREPASENKTGVDSMSDLIGALKGGSAETLLILGGNPVYDSPADLKLQLPGNRRLTSIYLGLFDNETAQQCTWHAPAAHYLEAWNDGRAWDGTYGIGQPLIYPLFDGISEIELLALVAGKPVDNGMELVRETARSEFDVDDEKKWNRLLHDGVLAGSQFETVETNPTREIKAPSESNPAHGNTSDAVPTEPHPPGHDGFELCFAPDTSTYDGRFANNGWLQELPDPLTKLTWDNAALISKQDADQRSLSNGDVISIEIDVDHKLPGIPVLIQPGQAVGTITLSVGYGRRTGVIATDVGTDVYSIRSADKRFTANAKIIRTGNRHELACTQEHHLIDAVGMAGRTYRVGERAKPGSLVRETTLQAHRQDPNAVHEGFHVPMAAPMFNPPDKFNSPSAWGMAIDLNACVGCNACVVACQAENNIPIVGKANIMQNREMHWLRIDRYFKGAVDAPDVVHVPMACAHCEDAPCEQVCPVAATVHDTEGLNAMVYNRCIGTRYCANNCPYKVRRFNYFDYHSSKPKVPAQPWLDIPDQQPTQEISELEQMVFNPEVTVRMRGVMEKCTYCVQRISEARIGARNEHAKGKRESSTLADGEVTTACQQACPTQAIRFGDLNNANSSVSKAHHDDRTYVMLEETNIKPRTRFLARVRNIDANVDPNVDSTEEVNHGHG